MIGKLWGCFVGYLHSWRKTPRIKELGLFLMSLMSHSLNWAGWLGSCRFDASQIWVKPVHCFIPISCIHLDELGEIFEVCVHVIFKCQNVSLVWMVSTKCSCEFFTPWRTHSVLSLSFTTRRGKGASWSLILWMNSMHSITTSSENQAANIWWVVSAAFVQVLLFPKWRQALVNFPSNANVGMMIQCGLACSSVSSLLPWLMFVTGLWKAPVPPARNLPVCQPLPVTFLLALQMAWHGLPVAKKSQTQKASALALVVLPWWWD